MYLSLKAVQWFTICGMSPPIVNLHDGDVPPIVNHCTAFNDSLYILSEMIVTVWVCLVVCCDNNLRKIVLTFKLP